MSYRGPLQLLPEFKQSLSPAFLRWYLATFTKRLNVYVHWSAGPYTVPFDDYHYCIHGNGRVELTFDGDPFQAIKAHTYARNHGSVGIGVLCMAGATTEDYGPCPPTPEQIDKLTDLCANICANYRIPVGAILTHAEAGDNRDYTDPDDPDAPHPPYGPEHGCERWDFHCVVDRSLHLRTARSYGSAPGATYFGDWLRGQVIQRLQEMSRRHWDPALGRGL